MSRRLLLLVPLLAMAPLFAGCSWFESSLGWYRATPNNERTAADLDACKQQARAVNRSEDRLRQDINGAGSFNDTLSTSRTDATLTRNMSGFSADRRFDRIVDDCMAARGYGPPGSQPAGKPTAPGGGVKITPPPSP